MKALLTFTLSLWLALSVAANPLILLSGSPPAAGGGSPSPTIQWWKLNDGSGTSLAADVGQTGTTNAAWVTGKSGSGSALNITPTEGAWTASPVSYGGASVITVACWVYLDSTAGTTVIAESSANVNFDAGCWIAYLDSGTLYVAMTDTAPGIKSMSCAAPATGAWVHLLLVYNFNTEALAAYFDGVAQTLSPSADAFTVATTATNQTLNVGARNAGASLGLDGRVDDFRIYSGDQSANVAAILADAQ